MLVGWLLELLVVGCNVGGVIVSCCSVVSRWSQWWSQWWSSWFGHACVVAGDDGRYHGVTVGRLCLVVSYVFRYECCGFVGL